MLQKKFNAIGAAGLATLLIFSPLASAGNKHKFGSGHGAHSSSASTQFIDYAKVLHVEPVFRRVDHYQPAQNCWYEDQEHTTTHYNKRKNRHRNGHNPAQAIVGGIVGGAIGNQIGRHSGRRDIRLGATVAGAIFGSAIANEGHTRHRYPQTSHTVTESRPVKRCEPSYQKHYKRKIVGFDVTYRYRGHSHTTRMQRDPGNRVLINVSISPQG